MSKSEPHIPNRTPVQRLHAESYLLVMLLFFAGSVSITRLFLEITGYPRLGAGELHFAHVLWGGLCLYIGCLLPLIFANRWAFYWSSGLAGVGIGLFIDEVGKFITTTNDYFYPAAAPIVYAVFLISVLIFIYIRASRHRRDSRTSFYDILQSLEEFIDRDLSLSEYQALLHALKGIERQSSDPDIASLAAQLGSFLKDHKLTIVEERDTPLIKLSMLLQDFEGRHITRRRNRAILSGMLLAWGSWSIAYPLSIILKIRSSDEFHLFLLDLMSNQLIRGAPGLTWFQIRIGLEGGVGLIILLSGIMILVGRDHAAIPLAIGATLISISVINLLIFYFDQFSTIIAAAVQFFLLLLLIRYRKRYLRST